MFRFNGLGLKVQVKRFRFKDLCSLIRFRLGIRFKSGSGSGPDSDLKA